MLDRARYPSPLFEFSLHCPAEWIGAHHNILIEGPETSTAPILRVLASDLRAPLMWLRAGIPFEAPGADVGALILQDVDGLSTEDQSRLHGWIDARPLTKIVSTTTHRLFALVECGRFDVDLYYRMNVILLRIDSVLIPSHQNNIGETGLMAATGPSRTPPALACPHCHSPITRFLPYVSQQAAVDYYCCDPCGHLWTRLKREREPNVIDTRNRRWRQPVRQALDR